MRKPFLIALLACQVSFGSFMSSRAIAQAPTPQEPQTQAPTKTQETVQPTEDDVVKISSNLVQVDAVVTRNGKPVTDLRPDEFEIFEDGRRQKITHFSFVGAEAPVVQPTRDKNAPPVPPAKLNPDDVRRTVALVVDDLGLSFESTYFVRRALKKFVDEQMAPGDLVAIIRTAGGMGALQQFTADKRQLYAAIERVKWYAAGRSGVGVFSPIDRSTIGATEEARAADEDFNQFREDVFAVGTLGAVGYVVKGMRELPGRKSILLISDGFRIYSPGDSERNYRALAALRRLIDQANRATVVIYTMNAAGLQTLGLTAADSTGGMSSADVERQLSDRSNRAFESQEGMNYLARETGGFDIRNTNDLSGGIRRVVEDQKSYYLIGYRPDESTFDAKTGRRTFHKLSLKISRPGKFNVRMRNGFFGVDDAEPDATAKTPNQQILNALISPFGASGVRLRLTTLFANDAKVGSYMRSLLHINADDLTFTDLPDSWHQAQFDVVAVTFGDNGQIVDQVAKSYTMRLAGKEYQRVRRDGIVYFLTVPIKKAGAYQLRAALRDHGSSHVGSASQFIEVPDIKKNRLTVSGILLTVMDPPAAKQPAPAGDAADKSPANGNDETIEASTANTAATRKFKVSETLQYSALIYNARLDKNSGQPQVKMQLQLFRDGQPIFSGRETALATTGQADLKRILVGGALQLGTDMQPGEYVLQITATDLLVDGKHRVATQWIDFEVVK